MKAGSRIEDILRSEYERCHPEDSFEALKHRAAFSKEDWRAAIRARAVNAAQPT